MPVTAGRTSGGVASANALATSVLPPAAKAAIESRAVLVPTSERTMPKRASVTERESASRMRIPRALPLRYRRPLRHRALGRRHEHRPALDRRLRGGREDAGRERVRAGDAARRAAGGDGP